MILTTKNLILPRAIIDMKMCDNYFRNANYKFYNRDKIFNIVSKIINKM